MSAAFARLRLGIRLLGDGQGSIDGQGDLATSMISAWVLTRLSVSCSLLVSLRRTEPR